MAASNQDTSSFNYVQVVEQKRLNDAREQGVPWKKWGPYLSERQWGTVREDYSKDGNAWDYFTHDQSRSRAYRWGEDGLAGLSDDKQQLCFALALWNGRDPILKERLFGLTNSESNHGEDVKEYYFYIDSTPTHSYMKYLYKYPQGEYPYSNLVETNKRRSREEMEYELLDTGIFDEDRYFDVFVEYAKSDPEDMLVKISVFNRGPEAAQIHVLPTLWYRNTWSWGDDEPSPLCARPGIRACWHRMRILATTRCSAMAPPSCCSPKMRRTSSVSGDSRTRHPTSKTPSIDYIIPAKRMQSILQKSGTKAAAHYVLDVPAGGVEGHPAAVKLEAGCRRVTSFREDLCFSPGGCRRILPSHNAPQLQRR